MDKGIDVRKNRLKKSLTVIEIFTWVFQYNLLT